MGAGLSNMLAEFNASCQYEPLGSSPQAGSKQNQELRPGDHARAPILPRCNRPFVPASNARRASWTQAFLDSTAALASVKLSRIRSRMSLAPSLLDFWPIQPSPLVFSPSPSNPPSPT